MNILLGPPNHDSQNSPDKTHELGSGAKNKMMCYELEPWVLTLFFCVNMGSLLFRRDFPKIHDSIDVVRVANEMKPYGVKILSSIMFFF